MSEKGDLHIIIGPAFPGSRPHVRNEIQGFLPQDPNHPVAVIGGELEGKTFVIDTANAIKHGIGAARRTIAEAIRSGQVDRFVGHPKTSRTKEATAMFEALRKVPGLEVTLLPNGKYQVERAEKKKSLWQKIVGL